MSEVSAVRDAAPSTPQPPPPGSSGHGRSGVFAVALGALGVVFGDIGTSPLYSMQTVFNADNKAVEATPADVYGVISLVFWSITLLVSVKYLTYIMRADNGGEGGIMALVALVQGVRLPGRKATVFVALGILGTALFYGDGIITPSISVLSAVEGVKVVDPALDAWVLPIVVAVVVLLFVIQRWGTSVVGRLFGPVMVVWFVVLGLLGLAEVVGHPGILRALSPTYGFEFFLKDPVIAFIALGSIVLVVTGAEALYADMGHFGRAPIRRAWFFLVFPALTLNYLGQGALILRTPSAISNPFYLLAPSWAYVPMVVLATVATVIASQAVISGAYSVTRQAIQLGFLPWLTTRHTSRREEGQIYLPAVNWALFVAVLATVLGFQTSSRLAAAYGVAVTGTFVCNTILFLAVAHFLWHKPKWKLIGFGAVFLTIEVAFFSASATKIFHGGWLPLAIAVVLFTAMMTWRRGQIMHREQRARKEGTFDDFVDGLTRLDPPIQRVEGTAIFLNANPETTPHALRANVHHNHVMHETTVTMSIRFAKVPFVPLEERLTVEELGEAPLIVTHLLVVFGYEERPDVPATVRQAIEQGLIDCDLEEDVISYFLSKDTITQTKAPGMSRWRKRLYLALGRNAASQVNRFNLADDRTVIMGEQIEI